MKKEDLFWAIGDVDDRLLERSEVPKRSSVIVKKAGATAAARSPRYELLHKWVSAACLLLAVSILIATLVIGGKYGFHLPPLLSPQTNSLPGGNTDPSTQNSGNQNDPTLTTTEKNESPDVIGWTIPEDFLATRYNWVIRDLEPLSEELCREIEYTWYVNKGYRFHWLDSENIVTRHYGMRYLGTFNGYVMLLHPTNNYEETTDYIVGQPQDTPHYLDLIIPGQQIITHYMGFEIVAYKNYTFYEKDPLENTFFFMNAGNVQQMIKNHKAIEQSIKRRTDLDLPWALTVKEYPSPTPLSKDQKDRLDAIQTINGDSPINWESDPDDKLPWAYYGEYEGAFVCFETTSTEIMKKYLLVGGRVFYHSRDFNIWVYKNDNRYALADAFNLGIVTLETIEEIAYHHAKSTEPIVEHPDTNREKKDVLSIPGAFLVENPVFVDAKKNAGCSFYNDRNDTISGIRNSRSEFIAVAEAENLKCYAIQKEGYVWYIVTFDLRINKPVTNIGEKDVLKNCIIGWSITGEHQGNVCYMPTYMASTLANFDGTFCASKAAGYHFPIDGISNYLGDEKYYARDYADYVVSARFNYGERGFNIRGQVIYFNEVLK